jgi:hypothetical protein
MQTIGASIPAVKKIDYCRFNNVSAPIFWAQGYSPFHIFLAQIRPDLQDALERNHPTWLDTTAPNLPFPVDGVKIIVWCTWATFFATLNYNLSLHTSQKKESKYLLFLAISLSENHNWKINLLRWIFCTLEISGNHLSQFKAGIAIAFTFLP